MLERLKRLVQAVISDLVDQARDPELELARFVEKLELSLGEVRAEAEKAAEGRTTAQGARWTRSQIKRVLDRRAFYRGTYSYSGIEAKARHAAIL